MIVRQVAVAAAIILCVTGHAQAQTPSASLPSADDGVPRPLEFAPITASRLQRDGWYSMGTPGLEKPTLAVDGSLVGRAMATFYPPESRRNHEEGDTAVEMCVDANGRTDSVSVISSSGFDRLDVVTVQMLNSMPLKPARLGGKPVPMCGYVFMVVWSLRKPPSPDDPQPDETQPDETQ